MKNRLLIFCLVSILLANGYFVWAEESVEERLPPRFVARLSIIPGMGQFYNKKKEKAWTIISLEVGAIAGTLVLHNIQQKAYRDWEVIPESEAKKRERYRERLEIYRTSRNTCIWFGGILWIYNMFDAYVDAHFYQFDERKRNEQKSSGFYLEKDLSENPKIFLSWEKYF